jgi:hypothetical protein
MFAEHRTYHLRESWVWKGLNAVARQDPQTYNVFLAPDAPERFGIGPAMVAAMRFWLRAVGLVTEQSSGHRGRKVALTDFGRLIWQADPYLEQVETVWFLHLHLVKNRRLAPVWFWFFNSYASAQPFDLLTCLDALHPWAIASLPDREITREALVKDLACLMRMYDSTRKACSPEEGKSPFARLHLLMYQQVHGKRQHRLLSPDPDRLSPFVLLYMLVVKQSEVRREMVQVSLTDALYEPGNVGRVIPLLTRTMLLDGLVGLRDIAPEWCVKLTHHDGQDMLTLPSCSPEQILCRTYRQKGW